MPASDETINAPRSLRRLGRGRFGGPLATTVSGGALYERNRSMSFRDNLQHLRATRNMTQEQLAMLLGVSRQTVTKWEAEKSNPEMDKLIDMCRIFDCTLDDLVRGDLTDRPREAVAMPSSGAPVDVCGYDEHMRGWAFSVATGVAVIILGVSAGMLFAMADLLPVRATRPFSWRCWPPFSLAWRF